ncbi:Uncharacterised protein [Streptomyces griseus]|nr:hypothetical protein SAMN04490359_2057 [Streptomyces griseus]SQA26782.1 Uncharacterised protein [Streptomyces griseus]
MLSTVPESAAPAFRRSPRGASSCPVAHIVPANRTRSDAAGARRARPQDARNPHLPVTGEMRVADGGRGPGGQPA